MSVTGAIIAGVGAAGAIGSAAIGSSAAGHAASTQAQAATTAAQIQAAQADRALQLQRDQFNTQQQNIAPWLNVGRSGLANLAYLSGILPPGSAQSSTSSVPAVHAPSDVGGNPATSTGAFDPSQYAGQSFNSLVSSGDSKISPNAETTQQWQAQGVPFQNITTSDGRQVAVRTDQVGASGSSTSGTADYSNLQNLSGLVNPNLGASGSLVAPFTEQFKAPTDVTEQNDPGYAFRLQQGEKAVQNSAASRGDLLSGGTAKAIQRYGQDYASSEYGALYGRQLGEFQQRYNIFNNDQTNTYNRLAALAGVGQQATSQLSSAGQNFANSGTNILLNSGNAQATGINNSAAARASGYVGSANAWTGALNNGTSSLQNLLLLGQLNKGGSNPAPLTNGYQVPDSLYGY